MGSGLMRSYRFRRGLLVRAPVALAVLAAAGVVGCSGAPLANPAGSSTASPHSAAPGPTALGPGTSTPVSPAPGGRESAASQPAAAVGDGSMQAFGEQVFALVAANRVRLNGLIVTPSEVSGETCTSVYSNQGMAIAAQTQDANMSKVPPVGTPVALVSACERGTTIVQIAADNTIDAQNETAVIDALWPDPLFSIVTGNADGTDSSSTHTASQQTMVGDSFAALDHLETLLGISALS
jgi:hypothetical protein